MYASSISSRRPLVSHAGRFGLNAGAEVGAVPSLDGGRTDWPLEGGRLPAGAGVARDLVMGPTLFDNLPADTIRLFAAAIGRAAGPRGPGPTVLESGFLAVVLAVKFALTLRVITVGLAANCFGAAALSASVILFEAGCVMPVSAILRFAPPPKTACDAGPLGPTRWDVVSSSSSWSPKTGGARGARPRIEGLLIIGLSGDFVCRWRMFGDFSAKGILLGDILEGCDGCGSRESCNKSG